MQMARNLDKVFVFVLDHIVESGAQRQLAEVVPAVDLGRAPSQRDLPKDLLGGVNRHLGGIASACTAAGLKANRWGSRPKYGATVLRELLLDFYVLNGRLPRQNEFGGGCLPAVNTYKREFGSVAAALGSAGLAKVAGRAA